MRPHWWWVWVAHPHLVSFRQKFQKNSEPNAGQPIRTQHLTYFQKIQGNTEIFMSADAPTRSAGQPICTRRNSENELRKTEASADRPSALTTSADALGL